MTATMVNSTACILLKFAHQGQSHNSIALKIASADIELIHRQSGHPNAEAMRHMFNISVPHFHCDACALAKSHRQPFPSTLPDVHWSLQMVYMDLSGKITPSSFGGASYYFKITNLYTKFCYVYLLSTKSEVFSLGLDSGMPEGRAHAPLNA
jgi:hypothetical protein